MQNLFDLTLLFSSAFFAATILPIQSEILLANLFYKNIYTPLTLISVATIGNSLGSIINWILGKYILHFKDRKWFPAKEKDLNRATKFYQKWGVWSLLLAWVPFLGDPLTIVAGVFRTNLLLFITLVTIGKAVRYFLFLKLL